MSLLISFAMAVSSGEPRGESENNKMKKSCPQRDSNPLALACQTGALTD